jgi:hypothetical protein
MAKKISPINFFSSKIGDIKRKKKEFMKIIFLLLYKLRVCMRDHLQRCSQYEKIIFHIQENYFPHPRKLFLDVENKP